MKDTVYRQAAIDAVNDVIAEYIPTLYGRYEALPLEMAIAIKRLPSADPERKKGEWIDCQEDGYVECPFCHSATNCDGNKEELHFCFSCGADMRGEQDESD